MLSLAFLEMLQWDVYVSIFKGNNIDEVKVIWKTGWCNYSLKIFKAAVSIESQVMLAAARQSGRRQFREVLSKPYLFHWEWHKSALFQHFLKDLEVRLPVVFVTIITKLDSHRQRSLNVFLMLLPPPHTSKPRSEAIQIADYFISHPAAQTVY